MPPTFAYVMCLLLWVLAAACVWVAAVVLAFIPDRRPLAKRLSAAMAGTFPGVFLFQALAAAPIGLFLVAGGWVLYHIPQHGLFYVAMFAVVIISTLGGAVLASITGFVLGWRAGWVWASGRPLGSDRVLGPLVQIPVRLRRLHSNRTEPRLD